jgi:arsenite methyltransferase
LAVLSRFLAGQFARPSGWVGRRLIAPWLDRISARMNRLVLDSLDLRAGDEVLEIGFGGGSLLAILLERGQGRVVGVDLSAEMVARARRRFKDQERLRLIHASVDALPLPSASVEKPAASTTSISGPTPPVP